MSGRLVHVTLRDRLNYPIDETNVGTVGDELPDTVIHSEKVYLRIAPGSTDYRLVSSWFSSDTAAKSFETAKVKRARTLVLEQARSEQCDQILVEAEDCVSLTPSE